MYNCNITSNMGHFHFFLNVDWAYSANLWKEMTELSPSLRRQEALVKLDFSLHLKLHLFRSNWFSWHYSQKIDWLIIYCFKSRSRIFHQRLWFHLNGDVFCRKKTDTTKISSRKRSEVTLVQKGGECEYMHKEQGYVSHPCTPGCDTEFHCRL
jgi:hypothetical protein